MKSREQLGTVILGYLGEILEGHCSITHETLESVIEDADLAQILSGLLLLQEELAERDSAKQAALQEQKEALRQLRETQQQLIQREKLASLGALTAGIAHELRNPLNFINNFARLSIDLAAGIQEDLAGSVAAAMPAKSAALAELDPYFADLKENLEKIWQHGQRADRIIQGMLMHSRDRLGDRGSTDINKILAESLNLAYHGMRARMPQWNIAIRTEYAPGLGLIQANALDLQRVFINMLDNAFYATERKRLEQGSGYEPVMQVSTRELGGAIEIRLRDNGIGIPAEVLGKIFLPFFTTKPPGDGVGLGLSISHDIIVLGHQGDVQVNSALGDFTEFVITLPRQAGHGDGGQQSRA